MKNRLSPLLGWLCVICLALGLAPAAGRAEPAAAEAQPGLNDFQSFVVDGNDLYVQAEDGLWHRDLQTHRDERLVTFEELDRLWQINNCFSLFVWDHSLAVADWDHGKLWRWNGDAFDRPVALSGTQAINQGYLINVAAQGDTLWVLNYENLLAFALSTGEARSVGVSGVSEIAATPEGGIVAIRREGMAQTLVHIASPAATPVELAQLDNPTDGGLACDGETGAVYAVVAGYLSRLDGARWTPLRPLTLWLGWQNFAVYADGFSFVDNSALAFIPFAAPAGTVQLNVRGINWSSSDDQHFMTEYPSITIHRLSATRFSAEDIYQSIATRDGETDLFFVPMSSGVRNLMEKGYLQALSPSEPLERDADRLYAFARDCCQVDGQRYAFPADALVGIWTQKKGVDLPALPTTVAELIDFAQAWDPADTSMPSVATAFYSQAWSRREYASYVLRQFILLAGGKPLDFQDPRLSAALARCAQLDALDQPYASLEDSEFNAAITADDLNALWGYNANEGEIIPPPTLDAGGEAVVPAELFVYVLNPYSTHQAEALTYLAYLAQNRSDSANALLCADAVPARYATHIEWATELDKQIADARDALAAGAPENRPALQESLDTLLDEQEMMEADNDSWIISPEALKRYRALYAPHIAPLLPPLLETSDKSQMNLGGMVNDCLNAWVEGKSTTAQLLSKLAAIDAGYRNE